METQQAEIVGSGDVAKVDSEVTDSGTDGSAPSGSETAAANAEANKVSESPEKKRDEWPERFNKLTGDLYELRGEISARDKRIAELEALNSEREAKQSQVAPDNLPTLESVGYDESKFVAALGQHFSKLAEKHGEAAASKKFQEFMQQQSAETMHSNWSKREAEHIKSNPGYVDKVKNASVLPISKELQQRLMNLDDGPQLAEFLVDNRERAAQIMRMPIEFQLMEVGRIQGELAAKKASPVSKAPPPVTKVDASNPPANFKVDTADSDGLSDAEWLRRRNAQEAARRKRAS